MRYDEMYCGILVSTGVITAPLSGLIVTTVILLWVSPSCPSVNH